MLNIHQLVKKIIMFGSLPKDDLVLLMRNYHIRDIAAPSAQHRRITNEFTATLDAINSLRALKDELDTFAKDLAIKNHLHPTSIRPLTLNNATLFAQLFDPTTLSDLECAIDTIKEVSRKIPKFCSANHFDMQGRTGQILKMLKSAASTAKFQINHTSGDHKLEAPPPHIMLEEKTISNASSLETIKHNFLQRDAKVDFALQYAEVAFLDFFESELDNYHVHLLDEMKKELRKANIPLQRYNDNFMELLERDISDPNSRAHQLLHNREAFKLAREKFYLNQASLQKLKDHTLSPPKRFEQFCDSYKNNLTTQIKERAYEALLWFIRKITFGRYGCSQGRSVNQTIQPYFNNVSTLFRDIKIKGRRVHFAKKTKKHDGDSLPSRSSPAR